MVKKSRKVPKPSRKRGEVTTTPPKHQGSGGLGNKSTPVSKSGGGKGSGTPTGTSGGGGSQVGVTAPTQKGQHFKVKLSETISINDSGSIREIANQRNKIQDEIERQRKEKAKEAEQQRKTELSMYNLRRNDRLYSVSPNQWSRMMNSANKKIKGLKTKQKERGQVIATLQGYRTEVSKTEYQTLTAPQSFEQSTQKVGIPKHSAGLLYGASATAKTVNKASGLIQGSPSTSGIEKIGGGKTYKVSIEDGVGASGSGGGRGKKADPFMPTSFQTGFIPQKAGTNSSRGYFEGQDYEVKGNQGYFETEYSSGYGRTKTGKNVFKLFKDETKPTKDFAVGIPLEVPKKAKTKKERRDAGELSVSDNLLQLGVEGAEALQSPDANIGGSYQPSKLKKDIFLTPLEGSIDVASQAFSGDPIGAGKSAKAKVTDFTQDFMADNEYWVGNVNANVRFITATLGIGEAVPLAGAGIRAVAKQKQRPQPIVDYLFPAKETIIKTDVPKSTTRTPSGIDVTTFETGSKKVTSGEIVKTKKYQGKVESTDYGQIAKAIEPDGNIRIQKTKTYESIEKITDVYGLDRHLVTFKDKSRATITGSKDPVIELFETPKKGKSGGSTSKIPQKVLQFDEQSAGNLLKAQRDATTVADKQKIYNAFMVGGKGIKIKNAGIASPQYLLGDVATGKITRVSKPTAEALGSRGEVVLQSETYTLSEMMLGRKAFGSDFGNLLRTGKFKNPSDTFAKTQKGASKSQYSLDFRMFQPQDLGTPIATTGVTKNPIKPKKGRKAKEPDALLPSEKDYTSTLGVKYDPFTFDVYGKGQKVTGYDYFASKNPQTPDIPKRGKSAFGDDYFGGSASGKSSKSKLETLTASEQKEVFDTFMGKGMESIETSQTQRSAPFMATGEAFKGQHALLDDLTKDKADKPTKTSTDGFERTESKGESYGYIMKDPFAKTKPSLKDKDGLSISVWDDLDNAVDMRTDAMPPAFVLDVNPKLATSKSTKLKQDAIPSFGLGVDSGVFSGLDEKTTPIQTSITDQITKQTFHTPPPDIPFIEEIPPNRPPPPRVPVGAGLPFNFALDDYFAPKKKHGKKAPRFWNTDPDNVLNFFPSRLGYQPKEFKQIKSKKGRKDFGGYNSYDAPKVWDF